MTPENLITRAALWIVPLVVAIVFHEVAHGWAARALGDPTAAEQRRLSLNPLRHVDPVGTVILPLGLALSGAPVFGWAKPVPVRADRLREPRSGMMLVALAGPATNLLLAGVAAVGLGLAGGEGLAAAFFRGALLINVFLAVFNLLPLPPFDGGHVVQGLLPRPLALRWAAFSRYGFLLLVGLLLLLPMVVPGLDLVGRIVMPPVAWLTGEYLRLAAALA